MNTTHDAIIGLEVHAQLNTQTKLFCSCSTFATQPNTTVCPTCLGHPGSKPVLNKKTLEYGTKIALALGCQLSRKIMFSRKTYFYPDLAKNYQITQYEIPLGSNGHITLDSGTVVKISRLHLEEDPASLIHEQNNVLVDYNRSGIPLCEIVTEPNIYSPEDAREFMNKLMNILLYLDVFKQDSIIKADVNVSIKKTNYTRVEIKNITGFKEIEKAIFYEIERQNKETVERETRGWNPDNCVTYPMRTKETEDDYGYIIDPDLPEFTLEQSFIDDMKKQIPELAQQRAQRYVKEHNIDSTDAKIIANDLAVAQLFDAVIKKSSPVLASKWFRRELFRVLNLKNKQLHETFITVHVLVELFELLERKKITDRIGQQIIERLSDEQFSPKTYVEQQQLERFDDETALGRLCDEIIQANPQAVTDYKNGIEKALKFLIGKAMAATKGQSDPVVIKKMFEEKLR